MLTLTLTQPYATLVAIGAKQIETRSWYSSVRDDILIHAATTYAGVGGKNAFISRKLDTQLPAELLLAALQG